MMKILNPHDRTTRAIRDADSTGSAKRTPGKAKRAPDETAPQGDRVVLSGRSKTADQAREVVAKTPEVRLERVEVLKEKMDRGEYHVDSEKVAAKLVEEHLSELL